MDDTLVAYRNQRVAAGVQTPSAAAQAAPIPQETTMNVIERRLALAAVTAIALLAAACGGADLDNGEALGGGGGAAGICEENDPDCDDPVNIDDPGGAEDADDPSDWDDAATEHATERAEALIGVDEASLGADVRVGRRGDETMMLTEDYVLGRLTVELDPDDGGTYRVSAVTVELRDGPVTVTE